MPLTYSVDYICPECLRPFSSTHWKRPDRCPACRKARRARKSLENYYKRMAAGYGTSKKRDRAYDGTRLGAPESVYAPLSVIKIKREIAACRSCRKVTHILNGYCELCRGNCANEAQCLNPKKIKA